MRLPFWKIVALGLAAALASRVECAEMPPTDLFEFHSGSWMNLHHALYNQASDPNLPAPKLEGTEREAWDAALTYYRKALIHRDLLRDEELTLIKAALAKREAADSLGQLPALPELASLLETAAPVYRKHLWPDDDRRNREWIGAVNALLTVHGAALASRLEAVYHEPWPGRPVRVDVVPVANWAGAYTSTEPTHIVISSTDPGYQGQAALEMVFHEASHGMMDKVQEALRAALKRRHKWLPRRDLWHALLFYTAGELTRRQLGDGYKPVADELFTRVWPMYREPIERFWKPYLDGKDSLEESIDRLVADVGIEPTPATPARKD